MAYDIADPGRVRRIHRLLLGYGIPLQYSIFHIRLDKLAFKQLCNRSQKTIDDEEDMLSIYRITEFELAMWRKVGTQLINHGLLVE